jgi:hypothetical protein
MPRNAGDTGRPGGSARLGAPPGAGDLVQVSNAVHVRALGSKLGTAPSARPGMAEGRARQLAPPRPVTIPRWSDGTEPRTLMRPRRARTALGGVFVGVPIVPGKFPTDMQVSEPLAGRFGWLSVEAVT